MPLPGLPPVWAIILAIVIVFFGGTYGVVWMVRREVRESRLQPGVEKAQELENQHKAEEIAGMLRDGVREAMAEMRQALADTRTENDRLRERVERLDQLVASGDEATQVARSQCRELQRELEQLKKERILDREEQDRHNVRVERLLAELTAAGVEIPAWWHAGG